MKYAVFARQFTAGIIAASASTMAFGANYVFLATYTDFGTDVNPAPDIFTITNLSDPGVQIDQIIIDLTGASNTPVFDTIDGATPTYFYGAALGAPVTGLNGITVGFVDPTGAQQASWEEGQSIELDFTAFLAGDAFAFTTDVDSVLDYFVSGAEFAGATFTVMFSDANGNQFIDSGAFVDALSSPATNDAYALVAGNTVPVPGALLLMLSGLAGLGASRMRRA